MLERVAGPLLRARATLTIAGVEAMVVMILRSAIEQPERFTPGCPAIPIPRPGDGTSVSRTVEGDAMRLSPGQLGAPFEGLDLKRMHSHRVLRPQVAQ